jgi:hypothetical protein
MERQINIDPNAGIFITMNPAGKGFGTLTSVYLSRADTAAAKSCLIT